MTAFSSSRHPGLRVYDMGLVFRWSLFCMQVYLYEYLTP